MHSAKLMEYYLSHSGDILQLVPVRHRPFFNNTLRKFKNLFDKYCNIYMYNNAYLYNFLYNIDMFFILMLTFCFDRFCWVSGCTCKINVETNKQSLKNHSLKNVSMYSDVQYTQSEVVFRKAYGIGEGLKMTYEELSNAAPCQQNETGCTMVSDFVLPEKVEGKINVSLIKEDSAPEENTDGNTEGTSAKTGIVASDNFNSVSSFNTPQPGCIKVCASYIALENHVLVGLHDVRLQKESVYDSILKNGQNSATV